MLLAAVADGGPTRRAVVAVRSRPGTTAISGERMSEHSREALRRRRGADAGAKAIRAAMRAGPVALRRGDALITPGGASGVAFRIQSGWIALVRSASASEGIHTVVGLALPGDLVGTDLLAASRADAAVCLGPVLAVVASEAVLRELAVSDTAAALWLSRQESAQRHWAEFRTAMVQEGGPRQERRRLTALLSWILDSLENQRGESVDAFLLPLSLEQTAGLVAASPERFGDALEWLLDTRLLRCAYPTAEGIVFGVADRSGLHAIGSWCPAGEGRGRKSQ